MKDLITIATHLVVLCTNLLASLLLFLKPVFSIISGKVSLFISERSIDREALKAFQSKRLRRKQSILIYCSSAGEYEQIKPIANRLNEEGHYVHFLFFSRSGISFARLRQESLDYSIAPLDTISNWKLVFNSLSPTLILVVRHEFWPCFLSEAKKRCPVFLVNASLKSKGRRSTLFKRLMMPFMDKIYVVSGLEKQAFAQTLGVAEQKIQVVGDSKYDRVLERVSSFQKNPHLFSQLKLQQLRIIAGSAWEEDWAVLIPAFAKVKLDFEAQLVIVPHQPTREHVDRLVELAKANKLTWSLFSNTDDETGKTELLIVDSVGVLFDLYGSCDAAFVGGAMHNEVHNVLEPASFGLALAFGPRFENSHEAKDMVHARLAAVIHDQEECAGWLRKILSLGKKKDQALMDFVLSKSGSSERILVEIRKVLREPT